MCYTYQAVKGETSSRYAAVAQLDRVTGYEPVGRGFESLQPYQLVASDISLATSFFILLQSSSRAHSATPRFQTATALLGCGLGAALRAAIFTFYHSVFFIHTGQTRSSELHNPGGACVRIYHFY